MRSQLTKMPQTVWVMAASLMGCASPAPRPAPPPVDPVPVGIPTLPAPVEAVVIEGQPGQAIHEHGGPPALLESARFSVRNNLPTSARIEVDEVEFLRGTDCDALPSDVVATPASGGLSKPGTAPSSVLTVPAGAETDVIVHFAAVEAATTSCDRFVFRVHFSVDGTPRISLVETHVEREAAGPPI